MTPDDAWADVRALLAWEPQPVDRDLLLQAHDVEQRHALPEGFEWPEYARTDFQNILNATR
jgi:hypothetical protein